MGAVDFVNKVLKNFFGQIEFVWRVIPRDMPCTDDGFIPPWDKDQDLWKSTICRLAWQSRGDARPDLIHDDVHRYRRDIPRTEGNCTEQLLNPCAHAVNNHSRSDFENLTGSKIPDLCPAD